MIKAEKLSDCKIHANPFYFKCFIKFITLCFLSQILQKPPGGLFYNLTQNKIKNIIYYKYYCSDIFFFLLPLLINNHFDMTIGNSGHNHGLLFLAEVFYTGITDRRMPLLTKQNRVFNKAE